MEEADLQVYLDFYNQIYAKCEFSEHLCETIRREIEILKSLLKMEEYTPQKRGISHIHWSNPTKEISEHPHQGLELVFLSFVSLVINTSENLKISPKISKDSTSAT